MAEPLWLSVARMTEGLAEFPGPGSNPLLLRWARDIGVGKIYADDETPWCAVFMNRLCRAMQWPMSGKGYELLRAMSFVTWGVSLVLPALGAVMVFKRSEGAHVGLYLGERPDAYWVFGGNTANAVGAAWISKGRLLALRWPSGVPVPQSAPVYLTATGEPVSTNEN